MTFLAPILNRIEQALPAEQWLPFPKIVAVSGGADSVALLRVVHIMQQQRDARLSQSSAANLIVAHVNHGLRGRQSDEEEAMVRELASNLGLECHSTRLNVPHDSSEETLRDLRYAFLVELAHHRGARIIATGHQADDQAETILFRICRGTGISGLAGIPQISALAAGLSIVRPLLNIWRNEIEGLLAELGQAHCDDSSNTQTVYARNFLRQEIMPLIVKRMGANVPAHLCRLGQQARELEEWLTLQTRAFDDCIQRVSERKIQMDCRSLRFQPDVLLRQFLKRVWTELGWPQQDMSFEKWQQLAKLTQHANHVAVTFPGRISASVIDHCLTLVSDC